MSFRNDLEEIIGVLGLLARLVTEAKDEVGRRDQILPEVLRKN